MKFIAKWGQLLLLPMLLILPLSSSSRSKPHLPTNEEVFSWVQEVVERTSKYPQFRRSGTPGDAAVRDFIVAKLREIGYETVAQQEYDVSLRH